VVQVGSRCSACGDAGDSSEAAMTENCETPVMRPEHRTRGQRMSSPDERDGVVITPGAEGMTAADLAGFFVGWPDPPTAARRLGIMRAADEVVVARDRAGAVIGFATALTDRRFAAYIPLVEVLPEHQGRGVGTRLVEALLGRLAGCYMIDLVCDDEGVPFYTRLGGTPLNAVVWRNHDRLG